MLGKSYHNELGSLIFACPGAFWGLPREFLKNHELAAKNLTYLLYTFGHTRKPGRNQQER
jgi:hypothetical protein